MVMIIAPKERVTYILERIIHLKTLLDNAWIYLMVMDPTNANEIFQYKKSLNWLSLSNKKIKVEVGKHKFESSTTY